MVVLMFTTEVTYMTYNAMSLTIWRQCLQKGNILKADEKYLKT